MSLCSGPAAANASKDFGGAISLRRKSLRTRARQMPQRIADAEENRGPSAVVPKVP